MSGEFTWQVRVYYEDTDAGGVVFYANYLRFMERARTEWLRSIGFEHEQLINKYEVLFAVKTLKIDYIKPGRLDDLLNVTSKLLNNRGASLTVQQSIKNDNEELLAQAEVKLACLNATTLKASPMPEKLLLALDKTWIPQLADTNTNYVF
ncbi:MAG: tol-pal system-associated acyl-CoA thioesterase [Proteobacteria bacterium]|nr:tol-pal system-associated acyl-CoA thioesterase [Pseudomonadota bacterium]